MSYRYVATMAAACGGRGFVAHILSKSTCKIAERGISITGASCRQSSRASRWNGGAACGRPHLKFNSKRLAVTILPNGSDLSSMPSIRLNSKSRSLITPSIVEWEHPSHPTGANCGYGFLQLPITRMPPAQRSRRCQSIHSATQRRHGSVKRSAAPDRYRQHCQDPGGPSRKDPELNGAHRQCARIRLRGDRVRVHRVLPDRMQQRIL